MLAKSYGKDLFFEWIPEKVNTMSDLGLFFFDDVCYLSCCYCWQCYCSDSRFAHSESALLFSGITDRYRVLVSMSVRANSQ